MKRVAIIGPLGGASLAASLPYSFTIKGASRYCGIPERTLNDKILSGELPAVRYGNGTKKNRYVILRRDLEAYLNANRVPPIRSCAVTEAS